MQSKRRIFVVAALLSLGALRTGAAGGAFTVIVNPQVAGAQIKRESLATIFLGSGARWPDGRPVQAVDQSTRSAIRASFCEQALAMSLPAVQSHWLRAISAGRGTPPPVRASDEDVLAFVRANPTAIGYVSAATALDASVRPLKIVD